MPSGCADKSSCIIRSRASVPIAENMSAYLAILSEVFLAAAVVMLPLLQKYRNVSTSGPPRRTGAGRRVAGPLGRDRGSRHLSGRVGWFAGRRGTRRTPHEAVLPYYSVLKLARFEGQNGHS